MLKFVEYPKELTAQAYRAKQSLATRAFNPRGPCDKMEAALVKFENSFQKLRAELFGCELSADDLREDTKGLTPDRYEAEVKALHLALAGLQAFINQTLVLAQTDIRKAAVAAVQSEQASMHCGLVTTADSVVMAARTRLNKYHTDMKWQLDAAVSSKRLVADIIASAAMVTKQIDKYSDCYEKFKNRRYIPQIENIDSLIDGQMNGFPQLGNFHDIKYLLNRIISTIENIDEVHDRLKSDIQIAADSKVEINKNLTRLETLLNKLSDTRAHRASKTPVSTNQEKTIEACHTLRAKFESIADAFNAAEQKAASLPIKMQRLKDEATAKAHFTTTQLSEKIVSDRVQRQAWETSQQKATIEKCIQQLSSGHAEWKALKEQLKREGVWLPGAVGFGPGMETLSNEIKGYGSLAAAQQQATAPALMASFDRTLSALAVYEACLSKAAIATRFVGLDPRSLSPHAGLVYKREIVEALKWLELRTEELKALKAHYQNLQQSAPRQGTLVSA